MLIDIILDGIAQLGEGLSGNGLGLGIGAAVHNDIQIVDTPVDQNAAASNGLGGKRAAQTRNGALDTEAHVYVIHFAQLTGIDHLFDQIDIVVEPVHNTDAQILAGFMLCFLHGLGFCIGTGSGLLAQNRLTCLQEVNGDGGMGIVGSTDRDCFDLGIIQNLLVVSDCLATAVLFNGSLCLFGNDVAEVLDVDLLVVHVGRDMGVVGDGAAANNRYVNLFFHCFHPFGFNDDMTIIPSVLFGHNNRFHTSFNKTHVNSATIFAVVSDNSGVRHRIGP